MTEILPASNSGVTVKGVPPARTPADLAALLTDVRRGQEVLAATGTWLVSGRRESDKTRAAYIQDVGWWVSWCQHSGEDPTQARPMVADLYLAALRGSGLSRATIGRRLAAVSSWYRYLLRQGLVEVNPIEGMDRPRVDTGTSKTRGLSEAQMVAMLDHALTNETPRTYALLWTMFATAGRVTSVINAQIEHLSEDQGHQTIDLVVMGNTEKRFVLPPPALDAIRVLLAARGNPTSGLLFTTSTGKRIDQPYVWRLMNRLAAAVGVPFKISPHSIRHTTITLALAQPGAKLHRVQELANHADPRTTQRYNRAKDALDGSPAYAVAGVVAGAMTGSRAEADEPEE